MNYRVYEQYRNHQKTRQFWSQPYEPRANFGSLLQGIETEGKSLVIEKRGRPRAVLLSIRDYVKLAAPEPQVLRVIGEESQRNGTTALSARQIDRIIRRARNRQKRR